MITRGRNNFALKMFLKKTDVQPVKHYKIFSSVNCGLTRANCQVPTNINIFSCVSFRTQISSFATKNAMEL